MHITLIIVEMYYLLSNYAHIHYLVTVNVQQTSVNVNGCILFHMEELNDTYLLYIHFHSRLYFAIYLKQGKKKWIIGRKIQPLLPYHQH